MWTRDYLRLAYEKGGLTRPRVGCWGLYRLIVGERRGVWLAEFAGVESDLSIARTLKAEERAGGWRQVEDGAERELDLVLMRGMVGEGRETVLAPLHVGCVVGPGRMMHIQETDGVMIQQFRGTARALAHPNVVHRVLGVYRPEALA